MTPRAAPPRLILVLGMHRTGSSLLTAGLRCLGVALGDRLMAAASDNPEGFFEDVDVMRLDDVVLAYHGFTWDELCGRHPILPVPLYSGGAAHLLRHRLERWPVFGLKDPRLCRLLPFWRPVLAELGVGMGLAVSVVHAVRHPLEVAQSLQHRNGLPLERGLALWQEHVQRALADADPTWPSVTVNYADMLRAPQNELTRVAHRLGLVADPAKLQSFAEQLVRPDLRHHQVRYLEPGPIRDLWGDLRAASCDLSVAK